MADPGGEQGSSSARVARLAVCLLLLGLERPNFSLGAPPTQRVTFNTEDGVTIAADFMPPKPNPGNEAAPLVILIHMYMQNRGDWLPLLPELHQRGYAVMAIDLRGHGESLVGPPGEALAERVMKRHVRVFRAMHRDVAAAYRWAASVASEKHIDLTRFALVGASLGSSIAIDYAARDRSVDVVTCLSPGLDYLGIDTVEHIRKYGSRPVLMLASPKEEAAPKALAALAPKVQVRLLAGAGHGTRMFETVRDLAEIIGEHLDAHLGHPTTQPVVASVHSEVFHEPASGIAKRISAANKRWFSSVDEARARGLRPGKRRAKKKD